MVFRKRGTTHIDWVISLGIFLFYIVWFFVFINPVISKSTELTPISYSIKENLQANDYVTFDKTPFFLRINENRTDKLIIMNFTPSYGSDSFFIENSDFYFYNNKIYLLKDYDSENLLIEIIESNNTYNKTPSSGDILIKDNTVQTSKELFSEFETSALKKVNYKEKNRIDNFEIRLGEEELTIKNETNISTGLYYQKNLESQRINFSTMIFAKNSMLFFSSEKNDRRLNKKVNLTMEINDFDSYFIDTETFGDIALNSSKCKENTGNYLKFYDDKDSLGFILPNDTDIKLCFNEENVKVTLILPNQNITESYIYFEDTNYTNSDFFDYSYKKGISEETRMLSLEKLNMLEYDNLKTSLGVPKERNFQISVWNNTLVEVNRDKLLFQVGEDPISSDNIYVNEYSDYINLNDTTKNRVTVSIKVW